MSFPVDPQPAPAVVRRIAGGRGVDAVWVNELGGVTFRIGDGAEFVKLSRLDVRGEVERLRWAAQYATVPRVLGSGADGERFWLHTAGLPGRSAVHPRWLATPSTAVAAIAEGLRTLHDRLPVHACPFDWSTPRRLARLTPASRAGLPAPPDVDRLVVCHGDACAPNTLIDHDGRFLGHVDVGDLGVADRWADLAVATLSLGWNYPGPSLEAEFFAAYGIAPDHERIAYYRRLWNAEDELPC